MRTRVQIDRASVEERSESRESSSGKRQRGCCDQSTQHGLPHGHWPLAGGGVRLLSGAGAGNGILTSERRRLRVTSTCVPS